MTEARTDDLPMNNPLGWHAICVNAVAPGIIDTPMVRGGVTQQFDALVEGAAKRRRSDVWENLRMSLQ